MSKNYKIPYINLEYDQEKLNERDIRWKKIQEEYEEFKNIPIDDTLRLQPWVPISKEIHTNFEFNSERPWYSKHNSKYNNVILEEDDPNMDFTGVYMTHLNGDHDIDNLTNHRKLKGYEYPGRLHIFGVSDNATQVKNYLDESIYAYQNNNESDIDKYFDGEKLIKFMQTMEEQNREYGFVLLLTPIVNKHRDSAGTWRWHKWGKYIGHHTIEHEYLNDEEGIDFVFVWKLVAVVKDED
jgi:hypothetical protein